MRRVDVVELLFNADDVLRGVISTSLLGVEAEDWVEARGVILSHVTIGACNGVKVSLVGDLVAYNGQMDAIARTLEPHNGFGDLQGCNLKARLGPNSEVKWLSFHCVCRNRVGKGRVIRCLEALDKLLACPGVFNFTIVVLNRKS